MSDGERRDSLSLNVRLNAGEREIVERKASEAGVTPTEWARLAALEKSPPARRVIPEINRDAWLELARLAATLNNTAGQFHPGDGRELSVILEAMRCELAGVRNHLIGNDERGEQ